MCGLCLHLQKKKEKNNIELITLVVWVNVVPKVHVSIHRAGS